MVITQENLKLNAFKKYCDVEPASLDALGVRFAALLPWCGDHIHVTDNHKQPTIFAHFFPDDPEYSTPNAKEDAVALWKIIKKCNIGEQDYGSFFATDVKFWTLLAVVR